MEDVSIKNILTNYNYLKKLHLLDDAELNKFLFNKQISNDEEIVDYVHSFIKEYELLPGKVDILNIESNDINKQSLKDYIIYLRELNYLDSNKNIYFFKNDLNTIIEYDKYLNSIDNAILYPEYSKLLRNREFNKYIEGISNNLFKLLNSINETYYEKITSGNDKVLELIKSLNTYKLWDNLDKKVRLVRLKNELIGRLLYVSVEYMNDYFKDYNDKSLRSSIGSLKLDDELLEKAKNIKVEKDIMEQVLELYPYSIEILRKGINYNDDNIDKYYYDLAVSNGYLLRNNTSNISYSIYNEIDIPLIPYCDRLEFLNKTLSYYNTYIKDKNNDYLDKFYENLDTYLRCVNYYDKDINKKYNIKELVKEFKNQTLNITISNEVVNLLPIGTRNIKESIYEELNACKEIYLYFLNEYKIEINDFSKVFEMNNEEDIISYLSTISYDDIKDKLNENKETILDYINKLKYVNKNTIYTMKLYCKEYTILNLGVFE